MNNFASLFWTTVGRKFWTALTGIALIGFVLVHLIGNLTLFLGNEAINDYAFFLETAFHRGLRPVGEIVLLILFGGHACTALSATLQNWRGRSQGYAQVRGAGGRSRQSLSSRTMWITGLALLGFVVLHVAQFRFGVGFQWYEYPGMRGENVRDLYRTVVEAFHNPIWVGLYVGAMVLLGFHLRHGLWSAFQTLGLLTPRLRALLYVLGVVVGVLLAVGFLALPLYVFLGVDPAGKFKSDEAMNPGQAVPAHSAPATTNGVTPGGMNQ